MIEPSGVQWCARYPTSVDVDDLLPAFANKVHDFIGRLEELGATVKVSATYRPPERAYLMHYCCMIADSGQTPDTVPPFKGVDIDWTHGGAQFLHQATSAAMAMKERYNIAFPAALVSRHTQRRAIDMTIINPPPNVVLLGASFGVKKLLSDAPHWSDDGH